MSKVKNLIIKVTVCHIGLLFKSGKLIISEMVPDRDVGLTTATNRLYGLSNSSN